VGVGGRGLVGGGWWAGVGGRGLVGGVWWAGVVGGGLVGGSGGWGLVSGASTNTQYSNRVEGRGPASMFFNTQKILNKV
jgi:hypothetical protein